MVGSTRVMMGWGISSSISLVERGTGFLMSEDEVGAEAWRTWTWRKGEKRGYGCFVSWYSLVGSDLLLGIMVLLGLWFEEEMASLVVCFDDESPATLDFA